MDNKDALLESFQHTRYQISGHGVRDVEVLKRSLQDTDGQLQSDLYGKGRIIEDFQNKLAQFLGKDRAVFFPSGTMAQQIALRIWCDRKGLKKVAYHPLCHLEIHEENGLRELHHIEALLLADEDRLIELRDVLDMNEDVSCLLLELPQREIGGQLPAFETLEAISGLCRDRGIKLHLDGARLFECLPFYGKSAADICSLFDSVYVSFYKGIGGIAGAILAGEQSFIEESTVWKRRHGGDLISLYPYILSADYYFDRRIGKMGQYYREAKELAALFDRCGMVSVKPQVPVSNMFHAHFHLPERTVASVLVGIHEDSGIGITSRLTTVRDRECRCEISVGDEYEFIPQADLHNAFDMMAARFEALT